MWKQVLYTPAGSTTLKTYLIQILDSSSQNRFHSIWVSFFIAAPRALTEAVLEVVKGLLETATWLVDLNRPREEGHEILIHSFLEIVHGIKTAVILPFLAVAGLFCPQTVFGSLENTRQILDQQARLEKAENPDQVILDRNLALTQAKYEKIQTIVLPKLHQKEKDLQEKIKESEAALNSKKTELETELATLRHVQTEGLHHEIMQLKKQEEELTSQIEKLKGEIQNLEAKRQAVPAVKGILKTSPPKVLSIQESDPEQEKAVEAIRRKRQEASGKKVKENEDKAQIEKTLAETIKILKDFQTTNDSLTQQLAAAKREISVLKNRTYSPATKTAKEQALGNGQIKPATKENILTSKN